MAWQLQEAKQRFSEVVHRAQTEGPQVVTRHGQEAVMIVDITHYRHLTRDEPDFRDFLLDFPRLAPEPADEVFAELAAERAAQFPRPADLAS